jgi:fucose 4-O-acetylase-like acetyltransferase
LRRLVSLDAIRGIGILVMMIAHGMIFAGAPAPGGEAQAPLMQAPEDPLATAFPFFFFITGISLAVSLHRRKESQSLPLITRHVVIRCGLLILVGLILSLLAWPGGLSFIANGREPVAMIGLAYLIAFPLVFFLSWQALLALTGVVFALVAMVLPSPLIPLLLGFLAPPLFTGPFSAFKTLPLALLGGSVGKKLVAQQGKMKRWLITSGVVIWGSSLVGTLIYGEPIQQSRSLYYFAIPMNGGLGLIGLGVFKLLEDRGFKLVPLTVLGRTALLVYMAHLILLAFFRMAIPHEPSIQWILFFSVLATAILWPAAYLYAKWRWKNFADQYA